MGGDLKFVDKDGVAELRVCEVPALPPKPTTATEGGREGSVTATPKPFASISHTPGTAKLVLNLPAGVTSYKEILQPGQTSAVLSKPKGTNLKEGHIITGSYVVPLAGSQGSAATIRVTEGMWEHRRGRKIHGGERRRAEVMHKAGVEASRKERR